jgi:signal transduction histidine kinase
MLSAVKSRLGGRILTLMAAVLLATSLVFLAIFAPVYQREIIGERRAVATKLTAMLEITLQNAMLKRDIDGLRDIVGRLGKSKNVDQVMILDPKGEVRFASDSAALGRKLDVSRLCPECSGKADAGDADAAFTRNEHDVEVLRSVGAVKNRPQCVACHGEVAANPINGLLVVDYSAVDIKNRTGILAASLAGAGLLIVIGALAAMWFALRRFVLQPVGALGRASRAFAQGELAARVGALTRAGRGDELSDLAQGFDDMAGRLQQTITQLRGREAFQQALIDAVPDGVRVIDADYRVVAANTAYCAQVGMTMNDVLAAPCYASSHKRDAPCVATIVVCPLTQLSGGGGPVKCSHVHVCRKAGGGDSSFAVEVVAGAFVDDDGRRYVVESIRDLSRQVQISQEQRLSEIGQLAAGVAHEIHNPLASVRLGLRAIDRGFAAKSVDPEIAEYMALVNSEIDRCLESTERLMRLSRLPDQRGSLIDLSRSARDAAALLRYEAELKHIAVTVDVGEAARIIASEGEIGMVFVNLVQNAMHAMPEGGDIAIVGNVEQNGDVVVRVRDSGMGISPEHLARIFDPFWSWRADGSTGSGLGLAICQSVINKWGGVIEVESALGQGTTFTLRFPHADETIEQDWS